MHGALSEREILQVWEVGCTQGALERSLTILAAADAAVDLDRLTVAERDRRLFQIREATFGFALHGFARCPSCAGALEFDLDTRELCSVADGAPSLEGAAALDLAGLALRVRLPTTGDLRLLPSAGAEEFLIECCVRAAESDEAVDATRLSREARDELAEFMARHAPLTNLSLDVRCPGCEASWPAPLDIGEFLWTEITDRARRLLGEVAELARAYCWREVDILQMGATRRHAYLELAGG